MTRSRICPQLLENPPSTYTKVIRSQFLLLSLQIGEVKQNPKSRRGSWLPVCGGRGAGRALRVPRRSWKQVRLLMNASKPPLTFSFIWRHEVTGHRLMFLHTFPVVPLRAMSCFSITSIWHSFWNLNIIFSEAVVFPGPIKLPCPSFANFSFRRPGIWKHLRAGDIAHVRQSRPLPPQSSGPVSSRSLLFLPKAVEQKGNQRSSQALKSPLWLSQTPPASQSLEEVHFLLLERGSLSCSFAHVVQRETETPVTVPVAGSPLTPLHQVFLTAFPALSTSYWERDDFVLFWTQDFLLQSASVRTAIQQRFPLETTLRWLKESNIWRHLQMTAEASVQYLDKAEIWKWDVLISVVQRSNFSSTIH